MRKKQVWRFYCEFCKKSGCSSYHLSNHERHCIHNPQRICRMCGLLGEAQAETEELVSAAAEGLEELRRVSNGCAVCMLVGAENWRKRTPPTEADPFPWVEGFNFDREKSAVWEMHNEEQARIVGW